MADFMSTALRYLRVAPLILICFTILVFTNLASAGDKKRIVILETMTLPLVQQGSEWFREGMAQAGHVEGQNVEFLVLNADGNLDRARQLLKQELDNQVPDMVVTVATLASRAGREILKDSDIPQVFFYVADPVKEEFVTALGQNSASNITGRTHVIPATAKLQVVAQSLSQKVSSGKFRIGLIHSTYPSAISDSNKIIAAAADYPQFEFTNLPFEYSDGENGKEKMKNAALDLLNQSKDKVDLLWYSSGPVENDPGFLRAVQETGIPVVFANNALATEYGALISLFTNPRIVGLAAASQADAIIKGGAVDTIPVTRLDRFAVAVNVTTAAQLEAVIPSELLKLAEDNIYR